jgi:hypothetical protein
VVVGWTIPQLLSAAFRLVSTNRDPNLLAEKVTKQGEVFRGRRVGRGSYFPLFLIFVFLLIVISRGFRLGESFLPPPPRALTAIWAALLSQLICFHTCRLSLSAQLASHLTTSSGKVTPTGCYAHTQDLA